MLIAFGIYSYNQEIPQLDPEESSCEEQLDECLTYADNFYMRCIGDGCDADRPPPIPSCSNNILDKCGKEPSTSSDPWTVTAYWRCRTNLEKEWDSEQNDNDNDGIGDCQNNKNFMNAECKERFDCSVIVQKK